MRFYTRNFLSNETARVDKKSEMMGLKKKLILACLCGVTTVSLVNAQPGGSPTIDKSIQAGVSIYQKKSDPADLTKMYKDITKENRVMQALELMKGTIGNYSRNAILGNNLTGKPMSIEFKNLSQIKPEYANFDALGWKKGSRLNIYINEKHSDAPPAAIAALLSHEALHQDELDSLNEETYAWTMEAAVWTQLTEKDPSAANRSHPLVFRENTLEKLLVKGDYSDKYIRKAVFSNPGYQNLPIRSPGYEDKDL